MPVATPPGFTVGLARPEDAIAAFERRGLLQPSFRWQDVFGDEHSRAFAVAGVSRLDVLEVFQAELDLSVREGRSLEDFAKRIRPQLAAKGYWGDVEVSDPATGETRVTTFDDARLRTVFDTNMRQSQAAGRWARIERTKKTLPFVMYRTMRDERVRASHRPWDGVTLPVDDAWWDTHYPPCGWRCRCRAFAIDQSDIDRRRAAGETVQTKAPPVQLGTFVNPRTGEIVPVPRGIDPGFGHNPGKARDAGLYDAMLRKALQTSPLAGATAVAQAAIDHGAMVARATAEFGQWVDALLASRKATGDIRFVGVVQPGAVRALQRRDVEIGSAAIAVIDRDVLHTLRDTKPDPASLPTELYRRLPELLARASAVLLERGKPDALLYVVDMPRTDGRVAKLVIWLDATARVKRSNLPLNLVHTATVMDPQALGDRVKYELLWGSLGG